MVTQTQTQPVIGATYLEVLETCSPSSRDEDVVNVMRLIKAPVVMVSRPRFGASALIMMKVVGAQETMSIEISDQGCKVVLWFRIPFPVTIEVSRHHDGTV